VRRWLFNFAAFLSLALCLASIVEWVHLGRVHLGFSVSPTIHSQFAAMACERVVVIRFSSVPWPISPRAEIQRGNLRIGAVTPNTSDVGELLAGGRPTSGWMWELADFAVVRRGYSYASRSGGAPHVSVDTSLFLPYWLIILFSIVVPGWWAVLRHRKRLREARAVSGRCVACGYDLRATPERCPECGAVAASFTCAGEPCRWSDDCAVFGGLRASCGRFW
jgi:hypothetical protein